MDDGTGVRPPQPRRAALAQLLELIGLAGLAIAEPVLSAFSDAAELFVQRRASALDLVLFVLVVTLAIPLVLWAVVRIATVLARRLGDAVHLVLLGGLGALLALRLLRHGTAWGPVLLVVVGSATGVAVLLLAWRFTSVRLWLRYLAVAPLVLAVLFLFASPASRVLFAQADASDRGLEPERTPPIVMLVLDELPLASLLDQDNQIDRELFPGFAELADRSTWFRNTSSVSPTTPQALPAILTSTLPPEAKAKAPTAANYPDNLFTLLGGTYRLRVMQSVTRMCPEDLCPDEEPASSEHPLQLLLGDAVDLYSRTVTLDRDRPAVDFAVRQSDARAPSRLQDFTDGIGRGGRPLLAFSHALLPHQPWRFLPDGRTYEAPVIAEGLGKGYAWTSDSAARVGQQRHLLQLQLADQKVGALLDRLDEVGMFDDAMVIVTADHGAAFTAGSPVRGLSEDNEAEILWVPLFVKLPAQQAGVVDDRPARSIDILPTIADVLGVTIPWEVEGRSLIGPAPAPDPGPDTRPFLDWYLNRVEPTKGNQILVDGADGFADMLALPPAAPPGPTERRIFQMGPDGSLVGRAVDELTVGEAASGRVRLEKLSELLDVDEGDPPPLYLKGSTSGVGNGLDRAQLAVAVDGVIGAVVQTQPSGTFWGLLWPEVVSTGRHDVAAYLIEEEGGLRPLVIVP